MYEWSCVSSGGAPTPLAHRCSWWWKFPHKLKCGVKTWWDMGMGHLQLRWVEHADMEKWVTVFLGDMLKKKNTGLQGSTLSGHRMTTGFGPYDIVAGPEETMHVQSEVGSSYCKPCYGTLTPRIKLCTKFPLPATCTSSLPLTTAPKAFPTYVCMSDSYVYILNCLVTWQCSCLLVIP